MRHFSDDDEVEGINLVVQYFMNAYPGKQFVGGLGNPEVDYAKNMKNLFNKCQINQEHSRIGACILG